MLPEPGTSRISLGRVPSHEIPEASCVTRLREVGQLVDDHVVEHARWSQQQPPVERQEPFREALPQRARWARTDRRVGWTRSTGANTATRASSTRRASRRSDRSSRSRSWLVPALTRRGSPLTVRWRPSASDGRAAARSRPAWMRTICRSSHAPCLSTSRAAARSGARMGKTTTASPSRVTVRRTCRARAERRTV